MPSVGRANAGVNGVAISCLVASLDMDSYAYLSELPEAPPMRGRAA